MSQQPKRRNRKDLILRLNEQLSFLDSSAAAFDSGREAEYVRLAVISRILVHDTKNQRSVLRQLGLKDSLKFVNTARPIDPTNMLTQNTLVVMVGGGPPETPFFKAPLGMARPPSRIPTSPRQGFEQWWRMGVIRDKHNEVFTREDLVLHVSDKEGGAHIDPNLPESWYVLTRENSIAWERLRGGVVVPAGSPVPASIRQIAHELQETIREQVSEAS